MTDSSFNVVTQNVPICFHWISTPHLNVLNLQRAWINVGRNDFYVTGRKRTA